MKPVKYSLLLILIFSIQPIYASTLSYPSSQQLSAIEIAEQAFFVLRAQLPINAISEKKNGEISRLINRRKGRKASVNTFESFINNNYHDGIIKQKQLAVFRSGKLKGTGILITHYVDIKRSPLMQIWLPKLRKVRRFAAPQADELWNGSNLTYGEVFLRQLNDEEHSLLSASTFNHCLETLTLPLNEQSKHTKNLPPAQCQHQGKSIYQLKSITRFKHWWYDYRISFIDTSSFAVYRTDYFKNDQLIKTVDIDWQSLQQKDPRLVYPAYLYSKSHLKQSESLFIVPRNTVFWDAKIKSSFWSESSLRKIKR